ncbi:hypothetical protein, partial [Pseudomonas sp. KCJK9111]|uniref:hypothetical protein n=1 Tax=Pseudomonas sp. KCJK9111 TaxID=3344555 RepID=UPI003905C405
GSVTLLSVDQTNYKKPEAGYGIKPGRCDDLYFQTRWKLIIVSGIKRAFTDAVFWRGYGARYQKNHEHSCTHAFIAPCCDKNS